MWRFSRNVIAWLLKLTGAEIERRDLAQSNTTPLIHDRYGGLNDIVELLLQMWGRPKCKHYY